MDNLTHTLIGVLVGETAARSTKPDEHGLPADTRRNLLVTLAAIGSNLPDFDVLYSFIGGKVNYLLHHRGHSHTILGALALATAAFVITLWLLRRRGLKPSRTDQAWLAGILIFTPLLHIAMDSTNNYGVHPFWPLYDGWLYGDSVFIAEPLLWAACAPLVFLLRTAVARSLVALSLAIGLGVGLVSGMLPPGVMLALVVLMAGMLALGRWAPPRVALAAAVALWLGVTAMFVAAGQIAARRAERIAAGDFPQGRLLDHVLTPMPANPLCWEFVLVESEADAVALRRGMLSLAPGWITAAGCGGRRLDQATAPLQRVKVADRDELKWYGETVTSRTLIAGMAAANCEAAAAMRFVRAPWLASIDGTLVLGDLRYDREAQLGFAEIELRRSPHCPAIVPPWLPPRADILRETAGPSSTTRRNDPQD